MASLLRSWARRAARLARDMQDVSPVSASNEIVASFQSERCVSERWRAWSDAPHGGTSTSSVTFVETGETSEPKCAAGVASETSDVGRRTGALFLRGVLSTKTNAPLAFDARDDASASATDAGRSASPKRLTGDDAKLDPEDPESLLTEEETSRSGYESRLAAIAANSRNVFFSKHPSNDATAPRSKLRRSGFAGCSTLDLPAGEYLDLDAFTALRYRVFSDGRKYVASIRTENWITGQKEDLWQAFLFSPKGRWADVYVPMRRFLKTWRGRVMEHEHEMRASRVVGLGIAVAGGGEVEPEGPFAIKVASIAGVRLGPEALEMARRREEAAWASGAPSPSLDEDALVSFVNGGSGKETEGVVGTRKGDEDERDEERSSTKTAFVAEKKSVFREEKKNASVSVATGVAPDELARAARDLRRAAEEDRARLALAAAPLVRKRRKPEFKGEMLPEFLGRKPEE